MTNARNPVSIRSKEKKSKAAKTSTRNSAAISSAAPAGRKKAGQTKNSTRSKAAASTKHPAGVDARSTKNESANTAKNSVATAARLPENRHPGLHDRSYAAHLDGGSQAPHTKPAGDLRFTAPFPTGRKQP